MSLTFKGKLKKGLKVGKKTHMAFELRQMTTKDMLQAELEASTATPLNYSAELITLQLVSVGRFEGTGEEAAYVAEFEGPFVVSMIHDLADPSDFHALRDGLQKVAILGEDLSSTTATA
ncbi:hypothetical protein [Herminiimonas contaminans]|uniref:Tail assembly chaperone E/41/14-like protein n=1 Tax=Herminiimonas contaminans TaxID=1111140 RepID=A0ABS0EY04_9BURK|nr:hypothetical protein [Herminiimonas contaminans]MBF8179660.1 hypothetical protein [Herminiimonas contaminans]